MTDALSDVLRNVRLTGAVFFAIDASAPWVVETPPSATIGHFIMPGVEHVIEYHLVASGSGWGGVTGQPPVRLEAGDIIVFPQGDAHVISSMPGLRGGPDVRSVSASRDKLPIPISLHGGQGEPTRIICGFLGCDARPFNPLLSALPRMIHERGAAEDNSVLKRLVEVAVTETRSPNLGSDGVLSRLSELLFVEIVRRHVATLPAETIGWFAGLKDDSVGRVLAKLHERPAHPWSLEELAREGGVSRSILAERFTALVGIPPIQYLAKWRVQLAVAMLRTTKSSIAEIAGRVGYGSEAALSRAFKREVGVAPATYRKSEQTAGP